MKEQLLGYSNSDICSRIDHTLLRQDATAPEIETLCREGIAGKAASVCLPASFVSFAADFVRKEIAVCTVIGFPNGYSTTAAKVFEAHDAVNNGADEIDMVINIGWVKEKKYKEVLEEIVAVKQACGRNILKVIIETCLLTDEEKIEMCKVVAQSGAEFIKTSTGFAGGGATEHDIRLFRQHGEGLSIKAAGGVRDAETAALFLSLGADRLGTSSLLNALTQNGGMATGSY
ncbi:MAG: deoxyribose-phosphate aldolase [Oscillospiraceae bacterium]|jgi:deoxyribose-phosphate aldolase|nr:deoxyribose-phosphate aldolase [Oscillospiraceae bacterium]